MTTHTLVDRRIVPVAGLPPETTATALFLHTGWRSSGTWLWTLLRHDPSVMAFYEPLHEQLATLTASRIARLRPDQWQSGHGNPAPYYTEFASLVAKRGRGVRFYRERFAADRFFLDEDARDPALAAYLAQLVDHAALAKRVPVLKFCRSLGRVAWMQRHFPHALHAVVLRDPRAQWRSARQQLAQSGNRYFLVSPLLIMARNAGHPLVAEALDRLDVTLPSLPAASSLAFDQEICWRHLARLDWAARYRGFLAFWTASAIAAFSQTQETSGLLAIDADELLTSGAHRDHVQATIAARLGLVLPLGSRAGARHAGEEEEPEAMSRAHAEVVGLLQSRGACLPGPAFARILAKLAPAEPSAAPERAPRPPPPAASRWRQAAYFAGLRLSMPLRRLHGSAKRLLSK